MTAGALHLSVCMDKSRIGGRGKFNNAIVLPSNDAFWGVPQAFSRTSMTYNM